MRLIFLIVASCCAIALAQQHDYEGYKVFELYPKTMEQLEALKEMEESFNIDYWTMTKLLHKPVVALVEPKYLHNFDLALWALGINNTIIIADVPWALQTERLDQWVAPTVPKGRISFTSYHRYGVIQDYVRQIATNHAIASHSVIGKSTEGRDLDMLSICKGTCGTKPAIFIECGIHAREWIAPAVCLFTIQELVENQSNGALTDNVDWFIVPVSNPDGYEYSHSNNRFWRKTRRVGTLCDGVDANRNFDFHWMEIGASANECSETYAGPEADSEPEVRAIESVILANQNQLKLYLGFHSYGQYFVHPWGFTTEKPEEEAQLKEAGRRAAAAIAAVAGTQYEVGSSIEILYAVSGSSKDWVMGVTDIGLAYTVELPGGGSGGFDLPPSRIDPVCKETWEGVKELHAYITENYVMK